MKCKKYNEIQLTKNKMDLNNRKMTNHPSSQFVNTIQSHLFTECIQDQFRFLKDCISLV